MNLLAIPIKHVFSSVPIIMYWVAYVLFNVNDVQETGNYMNLVEGN